MRAHDEDVLDSPTAWVAKHIREYVESDGDRGQVYHGVPALLLTTRGRRSGVLRRTALYYGRDGDRYLLVASDGGSATHPAWYLNLQADPEVTIQVGAERFAARASTATADEKPRLWKIMADMFPRYDEYQATSPRDIPLVVLQPHAAG